MKRDIILLLLFSVAFLNACNNKQPETAEETSPISIALVAEEPLTKINRTGEVIASIPVYRSAVDSFSLYLPKQFDSTKTFPLVVLFDPHGQSEMVLEKYKKQADKYGYIIATSKTYFNRSSGLVGIAVANALLNDLLLRLPVDNTKIIFAGFSGGAKIAIDAGCANAEVDAVVYSGSVILWERLAHNIEFLGIAGKEDMNYTELVSFHQSKYLKDKPHYLIEWNGKHEWPDANVFESAFLYPYSNIPAEKLFVFDAGSEKKFQLEKQLRQGYYDALQKQNLNWWKSEVQNMQLKAKDDIMYRRLLGLVSLSCYSFSQKFLSANDLANAEKIITIYEWVDPGNKDCALFKKDLQASKANQPKG